MSEQAIRIPVWRHDAIQDDAIDTHGLPFSPALLEHEVPGVVSETFRQSVGDTALHATPITQLSPGHARSYEVGFDADRPLAIWADSEGNRYTSLSLKGNNCSSFDITRSLTAPSGYIPYGLQEDDALLRVIRASATLRRARIPTEWIVGVYEPQCLPHTPTNEFVTQAEYKRRLVEHALVARDAEEAASVAKAIAPMTFFVTARAMEINQRPSDFIYDKSADDVERRFAKICAVYNTLHRTDEDFVPLDPTKHEDLVQYFGTVLPKLRARNLAKLHNAGLVHKFPVFGNTTALGGIIDLDSVHGEPLGIGDKSITQDDILRDLLTAHDTTHRSERDILLRLSNIDGLSDVAEKIWRANYRSPLTFSEEYIATRGFDPLSIDALQVWLAVLEGKSSRSLARTGAYGHIQSKVREVVDALVPSETLQAWKQDLSAYSRQTMEQFVSTMTEDALASHIDSAMAEIFREVGESKEELEPRELLGQIMWRLITDINFPMSAYSNPLPYKKITKDTPETVASIREWLREHTGSTSGRFGKTLLLTIAAHARYEAQSQVMQEALTTTFREQFSTALVYATRGRAAGLAGGNDRGMVTVNRGRLVGHAHELPYDELTRVLAERPNIEVTVSDFSHDDSQAPFTNLPPNTIQILSDGPAEDLTITGGLEHGKYQQFATLTGNRSSYIAFLVEESVGDNSTYKLVLHATGELAGRLNLTETAA